MSLMRLLEIWVKAPFLREASILISSECIWQLHREIWEDFSRNRVSLTICPEEEGCQGIVSKLATIIRTSNPKDLTVLTMEGSPHCFLLHNSVLQALFLTGSGVKSRHFVLLEGVPLEIQPDAIRFARYLHLVDKLFRKHPDTLEELRKISQEQRKAMEG